MPCGISCSRLVLAALVIAAVLASTAKAQRRWPDERQTGAFICHADFPLATETRLLDELSLLQAHLTEVFGLPQPSEPIHLFLFKTQATYETYLKQHFPRVPYRRALFIKGHGPGMVFAYQGSDFEIDVRHECTHALLHGWAPGVPLWLDEGLAEYFEVRREHRQTLNPHLATAQALVRLGQLPRLEELEVFDQISQMGRDEYRDSWAWVHFLLHGPAAARMELQRYLAELSANENPGPLSERLRKQIPDLSDQLVEHFLAPATQTRRASEGVFQR